MEKINKEWLSELTEFYKQLKEKQHLNNYLIEHFPNLSVFQYDEIQNNLEMIAFDIYQTRKQLTELLLTEKFDLNEKFEVIQLGKHRSIAIQNNIIYDETEIYLIDNSTIDLLDEIGMVEWNM